MTERQLPDGDDSAALAGIRARAVEAIPAPGLVALGSLSWGVAIAASAVAGMWLRNDLVIVSPPAIMAVFFCGASLAFAPTVWLCKMLLSRRGRVLGTAGAMLIAAIATHLSTAAIFALQYRVFYSHWHDNFPEKMWFVQLALTSAGAVFTFTTASLIYYWPFSGAVFVGFGLWFALRHATRAH